MEEKEYKLIYILSTSFSGSTFLDMLLGSHDDVIGLGETIFLPDYVIYGKKCMCGSVLKECNLWSKVLPDERDEEIKYFTPTFLHDRYYSYLKATGEYSQKINREYALYQFNNFRRVGAQANKNIFVDSSKSETQLKLLIDSCPDDFEIFVIHLIRDPLGYINSVVNWYGKKNYFRIGYEWLFGNLRFFKLLEENKMKYRSLMYKDLCFGTVDIINGILDDLNICNWSILPEFTVVGKHNIEGNPTKYHFNNVYYSQKWEKELSLKGKIVGGVFLLGYFFFKYKRKKRL